LHGIQLTDKNLHKSRVQLLTLWMHLCSPCAGDGKEPCQRSCSSNSDSHRATTSLTSLTIDSFCLFLNFTWNDSSSIWEFLSGYFSQIRFIQATVCGLSLFNFLDENVTIYFSMQWMKAPGANTLLDSLHLRFSNSYD
jgi:hypothetical protein